jgi:hypothetical protein
MYLLNEEVGKEKKKEKQMTIKAEKGNWDVDFPTEEKSTSADGQERRKAKYMQFKEARPYTVRLVGNHVKFLRHWSPFENKDRVITNASYKDDDPAWKAGFFPRKTFAIHVIDRSDGELKILEKGNQIFKEFARYKAINDINPAGKDGPDFVISVEIPHGDKRQTKYAVTAKAKPAPFTPEELEMIKANVYPLTDIYQSIPLQRIQELWDALPAESKIPPKRDKDEGTDTKGSATSVSQEVPSEKEEQPSTDDDLFADDAVGENSSDLF